uniref:Uncharacterized protein n=1 Tax=Avena sativa TaxID=4498 RepID=A0ACD5WAD8_AVESA
MARCSRASLLLLLLVIACGLVRSSYGSRPSPRELGALSPVQGHPSEPRHRDGTAKLRPSTEEGATGHRGANADGATLALVVDGGVVGSEQNNGGAVAQQLLLSSQPARRLLEEEVAGDSAARSSCRSNDARVGCTSQAGAALTNVRP